jgi:hypothetical protein
MTRSHHDEFFESQHLIQSAVREHLAGKDVNTEAEESCNLARASEDKLR